MGAEGATELPSVGLLAEPRAFPARVGLPAPKPRGADQRTGTLVFMESKMTAADFHHLSTPELEARVAKHDSLYGGLPKLPEDQVGILWEVIPRVVNAGLNGVLVQLHWGWTGPDEDLINYAEDAPRGFDSVLIGLSQLTDLRDRLNAVIEQHGSEEIQHPRMVAELADLNARITDADLLKLAVNHQPPAAFYDNEPAGIPATLSEAQP